MTPLYAEGLSNDNFVEIVEKMIAVLFTFASSGSGWLLEKIIRVNLKSTKYRPASGASYMDLPTYLQKCNSPQHTEPYRQQLFHLQHCRSFLSKEQWFWGRKTTISSLQPASEFAMPMDFNDIDKFETLNDVEVNVFGFENGILCPMRVSKKSISSLNLDILLLYESDKHHYVLIKD